MAATSVVARRHALFPAWLVWGGFVVAAALFLGFAFIVPVFGLLAWTVAVSVVLVRS